MTEIEPFPWNDRLPAKPLDETVRLLQQDMAYMTMNTAIKVRSNSAVFEMTVNTPRGQIVPRGEAKFTDGTTVEFQDIGMPQPGVPWFKTIDELVSTISGLAREMGLL